jgi:quercetin dioxygenase-like cupin family protein
MSDFLDKLRELTAALPPVPYERLARTINSHVELVLEQGSCEMFGLYAESDMSVAMAHVTADYRMAPHTHEQSEYFIVISGQMIAYIDGIGHSTEAGGMYHVAPNTNHWVEWPVATKVLVATIPHSKGFPDAA